MREKTDVPPRIDPRFPIVQQIAYEMADDVPAANLIAGDCLVCMPFDAIRNHPQQSDLLVVIRRRNGLEQFGLVRVGGNGECIALTGSGGDIGQPVAVVIGVFRPIG